MSVGPHVPHLFSEKYRVYVSSGTLFSRLKRWLLPRPCAWFHHERGCEKGANCEFCHLCEVGEIKRRKQDKMAALRKKDREREAAWLAAQQDAEEWCIRLHISLQKRIFRRGNVFYVAKM